MDLIKTCRLKKDLGPVHTSVATESWSGLNSFPLGKYRYKLFIERLSKGVFNILVRLVG